MAEYRLSQKADDDLVETFIYSFHKFGEAKARAYLFSIHETLSLLADQPGVGRRIDRIRKGYLRHEHISHSIFYTITASGIFVVRILHQKMKSEFHL